jgi:flagellar basal-body rod protein FlgG
MYGTYSLINGAIIHDLRFEIISNNLANINTTGFKRDTIAFRSMFKMKYITITDTSPGPIRHTGNKLDLAISSEGFFKVRTSRGIRYTRDGTFMLNSEKQLVTRNGDPVMGENGEITINGTDVEISTDGRIFVDGDMVDRIVLVDFRNKELLKKQGRSYYVYEGNKSEITPVENPSIQQGYIEGSNVNATEEMIKMIEAFRSFEATQKAIQAMDEMTRKIINESSIL